MLLSTYLILLFFILLAARPTRQFAIALTPWLLFACLYDWMKFYPNYLANPIDTEHVYSAELRLFGISDGAQTLTPSAYFALHHSAIADFFAGIFYLCWVPVPFAFALWLFFREERRWCDRYSWAFLLVNIVGFVGYYVHPAAPPWYVLEHGFQVVVDTPANAAGLARWDELTGLHIFHSLYSPHANSNVFAAIPSLHAAYMLVTLVYSVLSRRRWWTVVVFAMILTGIWCTAVYTAHHYVIDVLLGILTALAGILLSETIRWLYRRCQVPSSTPSRACP